MNDTTIAVLASTVAAAIAAIPPTLVALASLRASQRNAVKADTIIDASQRVATKADTIIEKAVEIHTLTNSSLSRVTAALEAANDKIGGLERLISSITADKVAASVVAKDAIAAASIKKEEVIPPKS